MTMHGRPCWFELSTSDPDAAAAFYAPLFGWTIADSGMEGVDYRLARSGDDPVAGLTGLGRNPPGTPPNWMTYICVDDADATARAAAGAGGTVLHPPTDIPGTGRFAVLADPQGAVLGILQPAPMDSPPSADQGAWNQQRSGRGNWLELMSTDPRAAFDFYAGLFGWTRGEAMDMGASPDDGTGPGSAYQLFRWQGTDIGGMMGLGNAPSPVWLPYFGVDAPVGRVVETITASGGHVAYGPVEVPGPAHVAVARDPQGAWFAVVGAD